jgi:membrane fusion protein (multidrug efflux system)
MFVKPRNWKAGPVGLACAAIVLALAGCGPKPAAPPATPEVGVVTLAWTPVTLSADLAGRTAAVTISDVRPQVAGLLKARLFQEGGLVHAGQPLYEIDPSLFKAAVDQAQAALDNARAALVTAAARDARYRQLAETEAVSRQDRDDVIAAADQDRATVEQDEAALKSARINLGYTIVTAPIAGRIGRSTVTPGALVTTAQADPLATIEQLDPIYVDITQSSAQLLRLRQDLARGGARPSVAGVRLKLEDGTDYPLAGTIEFTEVTVNQNTGTVVLRARFPNPDGVLLPGMFLRATVEEGFLPRAILAPQEAINRDAKGEATAMVVGADGRAVQRIVTTDRTVGDAWLVTSGLRAGDRLIVQGTAQVQPGMTVRAAPVSRDEAP